jgi:hypothetical protein
MLVSQSYSTMNIRFSPPTNQQGTVISMCYCTMNIGFFFNKSTMKIERKDQYNLLKRNGTVSQAVNDDPLNK